MTSLPLSPSVAIVVPTYNEADTVVALILEILKYSPRDVEVILVDDNSPDGTAALVQKAFAEDPRVRVIVRTHDRGFARSIRRGVEAATSELLVVMDSDFNHHPKDIPMLIGVASYANVVSGSRFAPGGNMQDRTRYLLSFAYNLVLRVILRTQVQDNLCGYFAMRRSDLQQLPLDEIFHGFGDYFFRLLHFAQRRSMTIIEVPVTVGLRRGGLAKNRPLRTLVQYTLALLRFSWRMRSWDRDIRQRAAGPESAADRA